MATKPRKTKVITMEAKVAQDRLNEAQRRMEEIQQTMEKAREEEQKMMEQVTSQINALCEENSLYCGLILTPKDVLTIVEAALSAKDNIQIPFRLYFKE